MSVTKHDIREIILRDGTTLVPRRCNAPKGGSKVGCRKCFAHGKPIICGQLRCQDMRHRIWLKKPVVRPKPQQRGKYLLIMEGDIEPMIRGPFKTDALRMKAARKWRRDHGNEDGLYPMAVLGFVSIDTFRGGDFPEA